ncbi:MAG: glutamyl-tRNA reductase, partial [Cyanobacteria bacterium REEB65]|nr:glutamyl-tRNA reductase [Cyanobacteria bacterium REEB65]
MFFQFGLSHAIAPVAVRERVAFAPFQLPEALESLTADARLSEVALLSTCNRTEFYVVADSEPLAREAIGRFLVQQRELSTSDIARFEVLCQLDAARHLLRVASGLESAILGEGQILGQVRDAAAAARSAGTLGPVLDSLFRHAVGAGKRVRTETAISQGAVSVGAAAVELARQEFGDLTDRTVLLLGAGKIGELTLKLLVSHGARK